MWVWGFKAMCDREDRLIVSLACGIGIASEEVENIKAQILALADMRGLLVVEEPVESTIIEVVTVHFPWNRIAWAVTILIAIGLCAVVGLPSANADRNCLVAGPPVSRIVKTLDGHFYVVNITRAKPGYPYTEWQTQREITEDQVPAELTRMQSSL